MKTNGPDHTTRLTGQTIDFETAFEAMPGYSALLDVDAPDYTILATTYEYLQPSGKSKEEVVGKSLFEAFPPSPYDPDFTGTENLSASFQKVITRKQTHQLPVQRYDIPNREGGFTEYYWQASNKPVLDAAGKVIYIIHTAEDITDRIKAQQNEEKIKGMQQAHNLFMQAPMAIHIIKGENLIIELANEPTLKLWGKGQEVVGQRLEDALPEIKGQGIAALLNKVRETGEPYEAYETPVTLVRRGKEELVYANFVFQPYYEQDITKAAGVLIIAIEVTERVVIKKQLAEQEQSLRESSEKFQTLLEVIPQMTWTNLPSGEVDFYNRKWYSYTGLTKEQTLLWDWRTVVHPDDLQHTQNDFLKALQTGNIFENENRYRRADGRYRWHLNRALPIRNEQGEITLWIGTATDIHDRRQTEQALKESEQRFQGAIEAVQGILWTNNASGEMEGEQPGWSALTGQSYEAYQGYGWAKAVHPDDAQPTIDAWNEAVQQNKTFIFEHRLRMKNGNWGHFAIRAIPQLNKDGIIREWVGVHTNITEQKQAEQALEKSERNLRNIILQSPVAMCILRGPEYKIEIANDRMFELWGKSPGELLSLPIFVGLPEAKEQGLELLLAKVYNNGETVKAYERPVNLPSNNKIETTYINFVYEPLYEADGAIAGILAVAAEVTEQVLARIRVEESEKEFRQLADSLPEMVWTTDNTGKQLFASKRWKEFTGIDPYDSATFQQIVHPEDWDNIIREWTDCLTSGRTYKTEVRIKSRTGEYHWFYVNGEPIKNEQGSIEKWAGAFTNVNERKKAEENLQLTSERFRMLADTMPQFVWTGDAAGNLNYYNKAVYDYSGLSFDEIKTGGWLQIVHPEERAENLRLWIEAVTTGKGFIFEHRFRRYDGVYRWQLSRATPQKDSAGAIQMWVGTSTDIHEIKELDEQKDYFIGMVSHELKTPVTSIKGHVQIMQRKYRNGEDAFLINSLAVINKQISKTTKLISDLLDVSKIKSGSLSLNKEHFSVNELIQEVIAEVKLINPIHAIRFAATAEVLVYADKERISQVLINLLTNAIKYSPDSQQVAVKSSVAGGEVQVAIEDFGIGISKNDQQKIFERFYRVEGKNEKTFPGFGIGLFISSEIIRRHNGNIGVMSELGKGSVFYFTLPLYIEE